MLYTKDLENVSADKSILTSPKQRREEINQIKSSLDKFYYFKKNH